VTQQVESNASARLLKVAANQRAPRLTRARLKGVNAVIGTMTTRFNPGNVKRTNNMRIAIAAIDGTLLSPGETFSLNGTVGDRTQAKGYRTTTIFKSGYKVSGIGGGVSQVTGTLFNAALLANLPIVTYRTHSRPVAYIPIARDATVSYGDFDMKFKNDKPAPIFIQYRLRGNRATATLFGPRSTQKVSLRAVSKRIGPREIKAQLYRTVRQNGKVVKKEKVGDSHYKWNQADWEE
jgi:vancomycin resistance protein YoaR